MTRAILLFVLALSAPLARADTLTGRASVIDGDTIEIHGVRIRILDIDAPESRQTCTDRDGAEWRCGEKAALALADWIGARPVNCESDELDQYKRHLARCTVAGQDLAAWIIAHGWAVPYRNCKCEVARTAADAAKSSRVGIWAGSFMLPWEASASQADDNTPASGGPADGHFPERITGISGLPDQRQHQREGRAHLLRTGQ